LFGERGVDGLINVDVTPEMAVRLALAYGSILPKGASVVTCRDLTRSARIVKRAIVAGLNSGGAECHDLELVPTPAARFYARSTRAMGGLSVQTTAHDPASVEISFFDERGIDIGPEMQRRLERAYYRDDLRRAFHHDIGGLDFPARGREYYARGLLDSVDTGLIRGRQPKIVIDYAWGGTILTGPAVLGRLGGDVLAVNGTLDEDRVVLSAEAETRHLESLSGLVRSSGAELGAMFDSPGERVRFVDGAGRVVDATTALLAFVSLVGETMDRPTVALPVATSRVAEELIRAGGGVVTWTRVAPSGLMEAAESSGVAFAGDEGGGYIFPPFLAAFDGVMALVKLLELLARAGTTLQEAVDEAAPRARHPTRGRGPVGVEGDRHAGPARAAGRDTGRHDRWREGLSRERLGSGRAPSTGAAGPGVGGGGLDGRRRSARPRVHVDDRRASRMIGGYASRPREAYPAALTLTTLPEEA